MRCSWCERYLNDYFDGALSAKTRVGVDAHLAGCAACTALLEELRVVDALLATAKPRELPINFTFAVMAGVRELPLPAAQRFAWWAAVCAYVALAWTAALALTLGADAGARSAAASVLSSLWSSVAGAGSALAGLSHAIGSTGPIATGVVTVVLMIDALALGGVFYFYRTLRPRLAAVIVRSSEVR